jgi:hypothetical protein
VKPKKKKRHRSSERPWMRTVKDLSHRKDRAGTRDALRQERYDEFAEREPFRHENPRGWD